MKTRSAILAVIIAIISSISVHAQYGGGAWNNGFNPWNPTQVICTNSSTNCTGSIAIAARMTLVNDADEYDILYVGYDYPPEYAYSNGGYVSLSPEFMDWEVLYPVYEWEDAWTLLLYGYTYNGNHYSVTSAYWDLGYNTDSENFSFIWVDDGNGGGYYLFEIFD